MAGGKKKKAGAKKSSKKKKVNKFFCYVAKHRKSGESMPTAAKRLKKSFQKATKATLAKIPCPKRKGGKKAAKKGGKKGKAKKRSSKNAGVANPWIAFLQQHANQGLTREQLQDAYYAQKSHENAQRRRTATATQKRQPAAVYDDQDYDANDVEDDGYFNDAVSPYHGNERAQAFADELALYDDLYGSPAHMNAPLPYAMNNVYGNVDENALLSEDDDVSDYNGSGSDSDSNSDESDGDSDANARKKKKKGSTKRRTTKGKLDRKGNCHSRAKGKRRGKFISKKNC